MLSFIIVNYNTKVMTYKTLGFIENSIEHEKFEIVLVDNASTDGSKEFFTGLMSQKSNFKYIYSEVNGGFGYANNIGSKYAEGDILVLINPDIEIHQKGFDEFIVNNLKDNIGILTPKIIYPDGSLQPNCGGFATFSTYIFQSLKLGYLSRKYHLVSKIAFIVKYFPFLKKTVIGKYSQNFQNSTCHQKSCDWVSGACMIIKKDLFGSIGGFDENFFMYVEDEDLCQRVRKKGYEIVINGEFTIVHMEGGTQNKKSNFLGKTKRERYKSAIYNFYKHKGILSAYILKSYFIFVQIISSLIFLLRLNLTSSIDRFKFAIELFKYSINQSGIAVVGYYSSGNIGDEFILHDLLKKENKNNNFFILSNRPDKTMKLHDCRSFRRKSIIGNFLTFLSSSKLIIGGGGLFLQNNIKTYYYYCCCVFFYKLFSKKVFISRVGIAYDALRSVQNRWLFERIVRHADFISVRDSDSYQEVIRYLPQLKDKIKIEDDYVIDYFKRQRFDRTKVEKQVGIALMQIDNFDYTKIANYLRDYVDKNYTIIFYIFFKNEGDLLITKKLISENSLKNYHIEEFKIEAPSLFEYVIESLSKNEIFISMRLHPLIISHMIGVDCKAIAHNLKIKNFAECNNIEEIK